MADQFKCVRLSSEPENRERIKSFTNERNVHLEAYLKEEAWDQDEGNWNAIYRSWMRMSMMTVW